LAQEVHIGSPDVENSLLQQGIYMKLTQLFLISAIMAAGIAVGGAGASGSGDAEHHSTPACVTCHYKSLISGDPKDKVIVRIC